MLLLKFAGNKAIDNGGGVFVSDAPFVAYSTTSLSCMFKYNAAKAGRGGGLFMERQATVDIRGCLFSENALQTGMEGGAMAVLNNARARVVNSEFRDNVAALFGGAMYAIHNSVIYMERNTFLRNVAGTMPARSGRGGAVYLGGSSAADIRACSFLQNTGGEFGGSLYAGENSGLTLATSTFTYNVAGAAGGGVYASHLKCQVTEGINDASRFKGWVPACEYEKGKCVDEVGGENGIMWEQSEIMCISVRDVHFRDNNAQLGGALFWEYVYNGTGAPILDCHNCNTGSITRTGRNDIATDAVSVVLGWFPTGTTIESGQRLFADDLIDFGDGLDRIMTCTEVLVNEGQGLTEANRYKKSVCSYAGWVVLSGAVDGKPALSDRLMGPMHQENADKACDDLRGEMLNKEGFLDEYCHTKRAYDPNAQPPVSTITPCANVDGDKCPLLCRKEEYMKCGNLSAALATFESETGRVVEFTRVDYAEKLPPSVFVKAVDYYGNHAAIDESTTCVVVRKIKAPPQMSANETDNDVDESVPDLLLTNVRQSASSGIVDFGRMDFSAYPIIEAAQSLQVRGEIGYMYDLEIQCKNRLPLDLLPIELEIGIQPCSPGKSLNKQRNCQRCRSGEYSTTGQACLPCPTGAICEQPCPRNERCSSELVGVTEPFTAPGYWQNLAARDMIDGSSQNLDWWGKPSVATKKIKTDVDGGGVKTGQLSRRRLSLTGPSSLLPGERREVSAGTPYCDWNQSDCLPGEYLDPEHGVCKQLTTKDPDRIYQCIEGKKFYSCPLGDSACPGSPNLCLNGITGQHFVCMNDSSVMEKTTVVNNQTIIAAPDIYNDICTKGYMGPMCKKCVPGYWKTAANTCERCLAQDGDPNSNDNDFRGDRTASMMLYMFAATCVGVVMLFILALYLRQDDGACLVKKLTFCCRRGTSKVNPEDVAKSSTSDYMHDKQASMWFRPEKFKILLAFVQIFSQMKSNYGVQWPPLLAEYMRIFSVVNVDIVKMAALDCIYRSDYYFGLAVVCAFPLAFLLFLCLVGLLGRAKFVTMLKLRPRRCVRSGQKVNHWMAPKLFMKMRMAAAKSNLEKDPAYMGMTPAGKAKALEQEIGENNSTLPIGCSIHKTEEFQRDVAERLPQKEITAICRENIRIWKLNIRQRLEFLRFINKLWKIFFWSLLLVYPSLSTRIIRLFACEQIGTVTVLTFDNSIECFTMRWLSFMVGAIIAGVLFVIGIPAFFLVVLKRAREKDIEKQWAIAVRYPKKRQLLLREAKEDADLHSEFWTLDKDGDGEHTIDEEEVAVKHFLRRKNMRFYRTYDRLGFIYYAYKEDIWWYELTELMRKLILNGFMVLVPQGVVSRVTLGMLVCLAFLLILNQVRPYKALSDELLQNLCHIQLFLTMFCGMLLKGKVPFLGFSPSLRPIEQEICGWFVIVSHAFCLLYGFFSVIYDRFFSYEQRLLTFKENKRQAELKLRMAKFKRAKKKLISQVRSNRMFSLGLGMHSAGNNAFASALADGKKASSTSVAKPVLPNGAGGDFAWPGEQSKKEQKGGAPQSSSASGTDSSSEGEANEKV